MRDPQIRDLVLKHPVLDTLEGLAKTLNTSPFGNKDPIKYSFAQAEILAYLRYGDSIKKREDEEYFQRAADNAQARDRYLFGLQNTPPPEFRETDDYDNVFDHIE